MRIGRASGVISAMAGLISLASMDLVRAQAPVETAGQAELVEGRLARAVREATEAFRDPQAAIPEGYVLSGGCVSGPENGAMGVHYVNASLVADGVLDASRPEALVYEPRNGQLQLAAAEFIVIAEQWDATNDHPPVLNGQHFHYVPSPNRSGLDAYYELHVWAWKRNPRGTFADWNPQVSCDTYAPDAE